MSKLEIPHPLPRRLHSCNTSWRRHPWLSSPTDLRLHNLDEPPRDPRNGRKDELGQEVTVLSYLIDTNEMEAWLLTDKLEYARQAAAKAVTSGSVSPIDMQSLAGFLSFCSLAFVQLGWISMRRIGPSLFHTLAPLNSSNDAYHRGSSSFQTSMECSSSRRRPKRLLASTQTRLIFCSGFLWVRACYSSDIFNFSDDSGLLFWYSDGMDGSYIQSLRPKLSNPYDHPTTSTFDINIYELSAILIALQSRGSIGPASPSLSPQAVPSPNQAYKYFVTFTDDYTRYSWTFCLKKKSDVLEAFKKYIRRMKLQFGWKLRRFRSDNGGILKDHLKMRFYGRFFYLPPSTTSSWLHTGCRGFLIP